MQKIDYLCSGIQISTVEKLPQVHVYKKKTCHLLVRWHVNVFNNG